MWRIAALCFLAVMVGCNSEPVAVDLATDEIALADELDFVPETVRLIRGYGESLQRLKGLDDDWNPIEADGILLITSPGRGESALNSLRDLLEDTPYTAYLHERGFGYGPDSIAVLADPDPFVYLGIVRLNGVNYDIEHAEVMERLRTWDEKYGLVLVGAGMDWMQAEFVDPPSDWSVFAAEVYEFCPDVVDQGAGCVSALAMELKRMNGVYLWWD